MAREEMTQRDEEYISRRRPKDTRPRADVQIFDDEDEIDPRVLRFAHKWSK